MWNAATGERVAAHALQTVRIDGVRVSPDGELLVSHSNDSRVVLYSRDRIMWATRVWWMLHAMSFERAAVLDGGFEKWLAEGRPVSKDPSAYPPATFTPTRGGGAVVLGGQF